MKYYYIASGIIVLLFYWLINFKKIMLVNNDYLISSLKLIYAFLTIFIIELLLFLIFEKTNVFLTRNRKVYLGLNVFNLAWYTCLLYLLYYLPPSIFKLPRTFLTIDGWDTSLAARVIYPLYGFLFLFIFFIPNIIFLVFFILSPFTNDNASK